jgi:hypothetical protein
MTDILSDNLMTGDFDNERDVDFDDPPLLNQDYGPGVCDGVGI